MADHSADEGFVVQQASEVDAAAVHAAVAWLDRYCRAALAFMQRCRYEPRQGSAAEREMRAEVLRTPYGMAASYLVSGTDYLLTLLQLFRSGFVPNFAGYALARGCLEAGARAAWLCDPSLTTKERAARGLLDRIDSLENQYKVDRDRNHLTERLEEVHRAAASCGIAMTKKKGNHYADGEYRPQVTPLVEKLLRDLTGLSEEQHWFFALLCGFTHSAGFATILSAHPGERESAGWTPMQTGINIAWLLGAVFVSARIHALALERLGQLAGWDGAPRP